MIELVKNGNTYRIKSLPSEMSLTEFDKFVKIFGSEKKEVDKWIEIVKVLGLPNKVANDLGAKSLIKIVIPFLDNKDNIEMKRVITIDGNEFTSHEEGEDFELSASQLSKIENIYKEDKKDISARIMAIIFNGKLSEAKRRDLFKEHMTADIVAPYAIYIQTEIIDTIDGLKS